MRCKWTWWDQWQVSGPDDAGEEGFTEGGDVSQDSLDRFFPFLPVC